MRAANFQAPFRANNVWQRLRAWWPGLLAIGLLLLVYALTLQRDINGSINEYALDTGEIQVALNIWGTIHYTGYPLYTVLSALLTWVIRSIGVAPAAAASATSLIWSLLGLFVFYRLLCRVIRGDALLAGLAVVAVGLIETFWMHSVIAEVYSFSILLMVLVVFLAARLRAQWHPGEWLLLVFLLGAAVAHHRISVLILPMVAILAWPQWWQWIKQHPAYLLFSLLAFLAPFLAYVYLPLRAWQGAPWVYGQPGTWSGLWKQFTGDEVIGNVIRLPQTAQGWADNFHFLAGCLTRQLPWFIWLVGLIGLLWLTWERFQVGLALLYGAAAFPLFVFLFPETVWAPAVLMPSLLCVAVGIAYLLHRLAQFTPVLRPAAWAGWVLLAAFLLRANLPFVKELTHDPGGRAIITLLQSIPNSDPSLGEKPLVAVPWGTGLSAAMYGLSVTHELPNIELVDHRADFKTLMERKGSILTPGIYASFWPPAWWEEHLGQVKFRAAAPGVVAISTEQPIRAVPADADFDLGNGIRIRSAAVSRISPNKMRLAVDWEAQQPITLDYSVATYLVTRFPPQGPADIIDQKDSAHPVQGWYPTTQWAVGEVVHDEYEYDIAAPDTTSPAAVGITMYRVNEAGQFEDSEWFVIRLPR